MKRLNKVLCILLLMAYVYTDDTINANELIVEEKPLVSIHAEDTHLPSILAILASESGYNIVTGPNVQTQNKLTNKLKGLLK